MKCPKDIWSPRTFDRQTLKSLWEADIPSLLTMITSRVELLTNDVRSCGRLRICPLYPYWPWGRRYTDMIGRTREINISLTWDSPYTCSTTDCTYVNAAGLWFCHSNDKSTHTISKLKVGLDGTGPGSILLAAEYNLGTAQSMWQRWHTPVLFVVLKYKLF